MNMTTTAKAMPTQRIACRKCHIEAKPEHSYCCHCGAPLKASKRAKHMALATTKHFIIPVIVTSVLTLLAMFLVGKANYIMPPATEAREAIASTPMASTSPDGCASKLIANATNEIDRPDAFEDIEEASQYIPPSVDKLLSERGWKIEFVPEGALPDAICGYCNILTKVITVEDRWFTSHPISHTTLHEIGHAVDFECGFPSLLTDFVTASQREESWSASLTRDMRLSDADTVPGQRFAQAFLHYTLHPEDREGAERLYEWLDNNIF